MLVKLQQVTDAAMMNDEGETTIESMTKRDTRTEEVTKTVENMEIGIMIGIIIALRIRKIIMKVGIGIDMTTRGGTGNGVEAPLDLGDDDR